MTVLLDAVVRDSTLRDEPPAGESLRARASAVLCGEMRVGAAIAGSVADTPTIRQAGSRVEYDTESNILISQRRCR